MSSKKKKSSPKTPHEWRSPRTKKPSEKLHSIQTDSVVHRRSTEMAPSLPVASSSFSEATPRTLLENFIHGHDTVQTTTRKRPRLAVSPEKSPLKTPVQHSPGKKPNRSYTTSLRKKATMNNFLTQDLDGPTPRSMIQAFVSDAPTETPIIGTVIYQQGNPANKSIALDQTRTELEAESTLEDSFLGVHSQPPTDRVRNRKASQPRKHTVDISKFSSDVRDQLSRTVSVELPRLDNVNEADISKASQDMEDGNDRRTEEFAVTGSGTSTRQDKRTVLRSQKLNRSRSHQDVFEEFTSSKLPGSLEMGPGDTDVADLSENMQVIEAEVYHSFSTGESDNNDERNSLPEEGAHLEESGRQKNRSLYMDSNADVSSVAEVVVENEESQRERISENLHEVRPDSRTEAPQTDEQNSGGHESSLAEPSQIEETIQNTSSINQEQDPTQEQDSHEQDNSGMEPDKEQSTTEQDRSELPETEMISPPGGSQQLFTDDEEEEEEEASGSVPKLKQVLITEILHSPALQLSDSERADMDTSMAQWMKPQETSRTSGLKPKQVTKPSSKSDKGAKTKIDKPARLPRSLTKSIFQHFTRSKRLSKEVLDEIEKVSDSYWKNVSNDLATYSRHAHRRGIEEADVDLLMKRQGFVTGKQSMYSLVEEYLPLEYRQEIIPIARSGNRIESKR